MMTDLLLECTETAQEDWQPLRELPFLSWTELCAQLEGHIANAHPDILLKFTTWVRSLNLVSVWASQDAIRIQLGSPSAHRIREVQKIQPLLEELLSDQVFGSRAVSLELAGPSQSPAALSSPSPQPASVPGAQQNHALKPSGAPTVEAQPARSHPGQPEPFALEPASPPADSHTPPIQAVNAPGTTRATPPLSSTSPLPAPVPSARKDHALKPSSTPPVEAQPAWSHPDQSKPAALPDVAGRPVVDPSAPGNIPATSGTNSRPVSPPWLAPAIPALRSSRSPVGRPQPPALPLNDILVDPQYATRYDEIVHGHSAIYLPAYFIRHLRHMGASNGLRFLGLRQIAYKNGLKDAGGSQTLPATLTEIARWSTLSLRSLPGDLDNPDSYLSLLAGKESYLAHWQAQPPSARWEDAAGYHWRSKDREYIIWKKAGQPVSENSQCSQVLTNRLNGDTFYRQAPGIYRVQVSMPLSPEDEQSLRARLVSMGCAEDPLEAIRRCLALPRDEIIPDRPQKLAHKPERLYCVPELVMEVWGKPERSLAAQVAIQSKILEEHLLRPRDLLKIPLYLLEKWGKYFSPSQIWTLIILMDRVYAGQPGGDYRDTTLIRSGVREMVCWTEEEFQPGAAKKIARWLHPFNALEAKERETPNPWFSTFVSEILGPNGVRVKNPDNSAQIRLKVIPVVPLCPEDTLQFSAQMKLTRLLLRDAAGARLGLEITPEEFVIYTPDQRTLRFSHSGELRFGERGPLELRALDHELGGIQLLSDERFYDEKAWSDALFCGVENRAGRHFCGVENGPDGLNCVVEKLPDGHFCSLPLGPEGLFCVLIKLLILNLYGIKQNSHEEKAPSIPELPPNVDTLEQFGSRQGYFMHWAEEESGLDWDFGMLTHAMGIADVKGLQNAGVQAGDIVACALELYATPRERFKSGRIPVLVSRLRANTSPAAGVYQRLAEQGPERLHTYLRRAISSGWSDAVADPDWKSALGKADRDDLIELAEKLGLGQVMHTNPNQGK